VLPRTLSASALKVAESCPARYYAENIMRGKQPQSGAANLGLAVHQALEKFIMGVKIRKDASWDFAVLLALYDQAYLEIIGADKQSPVYRDGKQLIAAWFNRDYIWNDIFGRTTLSVESKNSFPIKVKWDGDVVEVPFNYIFDRLDKQSETEFTVVDYKTGRFALTTDELRENLQARAYGLAVATKYPKAERIWVEFDFLRHEKIGVAFTREDNVATYRMIQEALRRILSYDETGALPETLNDECGWCIRKATCGALQSNLAAGGVTNLDLNGQAVLFYKLQAQIKAATTLKNDLEKRLLLHASAEEIIDFDTDDARVRVSMNSRRQVNQDAARKILGDFIYNQYRGGIKIGDLDDIDLRADISGGQKAALKSAIIKPPGNPSIKVALKNE